MRVRIMVLKATSNNISIISGGGVVLFVEETGVPGENPRRPVVSHCIHTTTKFINYKNANRIQLIIDFRYWFISHIECMYKFQMIEFKDRGTYLIFVIQRAF